ncbi:hypothetical protein AB5N19_00263 [Seiridium cardinale]
MFMPWVVIRYYGFDYNEPTTIDAFGIMLTFSLNSGFLGVFIIVFATRTSPSVWSEYTNKDELLSELIQALRERRATVPKDKALAVHRVMSCMGLSTIVPEYSKPYGDIYHQVFLDLLRH